MADPCRRSRHRLRPGSSPLLLALLLVVLLAGCSTAGFYRQSLWGGFQMMRGRQPVARLLGDPGTPAGLKGRLALAAELRRFAISELGLPDNGSYRVYKHLARPYVVWNVVAAPELAVEPVTWCFPIAGCVAYRGYFAEEKAERFAARLRRKGLETDVRGAAAFSTLGRLKDPLLSTFLDYPDAELAGLLFHELAHQRLYVKGDTTFNESFATAVELEGVRRWLAACGEPESDAGYRRGKERQREFARLVTGARGRLDAAFRAPESDDWKRAQKAEIYADLRQEYRELRSSWDGYDGYDGWFGEGLNNARLAAIGAYHELVPAFEALLAEGGGDLEAFYREVSRIAGLPREERRRALSSPKGGAFTRPPPARPPA